MNNFLRKVDNFPTFDEHIAWLEEKIKENESCIKECNEEIEEDKKELEEVKAEKKRIEENPETYEPSIYLGGWADTKEKKQIVYNWAQAHEIKHHTELVGNYWKGLKIKTYHQPNYEFITAHSNTSKIRYVRCRDCYEEVLRNGLEDEAIKLNYQVMLDD